MEIDVTPHPSLIEKIGHASFSIWQAISELIANSLDAMPLDKKAYIDITANLNEIVVKDNARGMDRAVLEKAVRMAWPMNNIISYGNKVKRVFGLGMKTACASLGRYWTLETITKDSDTGYRVIFDFKKITQESNTKWIAEIEEFSRDEIKLPGNSRSGTIITVKELKVKPIPDRLQKEICQAYLPHIRNGDIFTVNGHQLKEIPLDLIPNSRVDIDVKIAGMRITGWGALMRKGSLTNYGFHWYRRGQLIEAYDKSFIPNHPTYRQIIGELHADDMPVNFTKKGFEKETPQWKQAIEELPKHFATLLKDAKKTRRERSPNPWEEKKMDENLDIISKVGSKIAEKIEVDGALSGGYLDSSLIDEINAEKLTERDMKVEHVSRYIANPMKIGDINIQWRHRFRSLGEDAPIVDYILEMKNQILFVTNEDSPFTKFIDDDEFLVIITIADGFMKFLIEELEFSPVKAMAFRDRILINSCAARLDVI